MNSNINLSVAELMCSRVIHDLVNPANAVSSGLTVYFDEKESGNEEGAAHSLKLAIKGSNISTSKLNLYRIAFGLYGGGGGTIQIANVETTCRDYIDSLSLPHTLNLKFANLESGEVAKEVTKVLLNIILLSLECSQKASDIEAIVARLPDGWGIAVKTIGKRIVIRDDIARAISDDVLINELTARNVQAYFTYRLADDLNSKIELKLVHDNTLEIATLISDDNIVT